MQETGQPRRKPPTSIWHADQAFDLAIFGGRGSGALAALIFGRLAAVNGGTCLGFLNDVEEAGTRISGHPVLGPFVSWTHLPTTTRFVAPLHKAKEMQRRAAIINGLGIPRERWANLIDPQALIAGDARCGVGIVVAPFGRVLPSARLGDHVTVRGGAEISHDVTIGDFVMVGVNAVVCGWSTIGEGTHVAPGAVIRDRTTVGRYCVIGLGAIVVGDVPDGAIVAGNPARIIGHIGHGGAQSALAKALQ